VKNFRATLIFWTSASCSKILNDKKYLFNALNSGHTLFFRASASCYKILNGEKMFNTVYSVYIHLGVIRVIWASVVCNLNQRGEWL